MTAKDYKTLAEALCSARKTAVGSRRIGVDIATNAIAEALKANNPRFDEGTFYAAARGEA